MAELESLKEIQETRKWGGARVGAGRKAHGKNREVIEREEAKRQFKERVAKNVDKLFNAQLDLALGEKYLMVIETIKTSKGERKETSIVTDPEVIKQFLDGDLDNTDTEYYYMSTKPANNLALDSLLNRSFGKADEKLDITTDGEKLETIEMPVVLINKFNNWLSADTKL